MLLNRQTLATFSSAGVDDCPATASFHAHTETVSALATGDGWLVSTFHDNSAQNIRESPLFHQKTEI